MADDSIDINLNDLYRWSRELDAEALDKARAEHGDDYYKMLYVAAYLFTQFADKLQEGEFVEEMNKGWD